MNNPYRPVAPRFVSDAYKQEWELHLRITIKDINQQIIKGWRVVNLKYLLFYRPSFLPHIIKEYEKVGWTVTRKKFLRWETDTLRFSVVVPVDGE